MSSGKWRSFCLGLNVLMQGRHNSSALAMRLHLSCTNPQKYMEYGHIKNYKKKKRKQEIDVMNLIRYMLAQKKSCISLGQGNTYQ